MVGLGSDQKSLERDTEEGAVRLEIGNEEYTRGIRRHEGTVAFDGDPYLDDAKLADLFAFLLPGNEARRRVELGEDPRDVIMRSVDGNAIQAEVSQFQSERDGTGDLRTWVDRIGEWAIAGSNEHTETVLEILDYDHLDRIWIERYKQEIKQGRRKVTETVFQLHVVRSTEDGVTYADEFTHLSEGEREVTGVVFAPVGYLAHEVYGDVPFIMLNSVESIDAERIDQLVTYLEDYTEYLVVALLSEEARIPDYEFRRIEPD